MSWIALAIVLIVFWPATCELARLGRRVRAQRRAQQTASHATDSRKEKP